ncbi:MAG: ABC transporter permease, partial [Arenimonas sp.]
MISLRRIAALVRKEIRQLRRDHLTVGMVAVIPLALLVLFGYAINTEVRHLKAAIADQSGTQLSRILTADAQASQVIRIVARVRTAEELETLLRTGRISVGLYIPRDFARRVQTPGLPAAQLLINGTDPLILTAARQLTDMVLRHAVDHPAATRTSLFEIRNYYNPERRSAVHIVPGLIGVI